MTQVDQMKKGLKVYYGRTKEFGIVSSWNNHYVFVLYDGDIYPKATNYEDLIIVQ